MGRWNIQYWQLCKLYQFNFYSSSFKMSLNSRRGEGHRFDNLPNNDLDQKLTYQQLLNLTHDLSKENVILKNQTRRLGEQLRYLHSQFDIKPREENAQLYHAIGAHPVLHQYEATLVPLLEAYQYNIQEFERGFETVHEQFFTLEKKFEEVCMENQDLKMKLTDKIKQLVELYRNGGNEKMHSDFGQIILDQVNEKQKALVQENARLQRDYQKYKAEAERSNSQLELVQKKLEENKSKMRELEINLKGLQTENTNLKDSSFQQQIKISEIEAEKRKLEQAHQRAQSQNNQLNKQKDIYKNRLEQLKARIEKDTSLPIENDQGKLIEQLQTKISFLEAEQGPNDSHKRLTKLQKDYDALVKERQRLKETIDSAKIRQDQLNETITEMRGQISKLTTQKQTLEKNESRINKSLQNLGEKSKNDILKIKKQAQDDIDKIEFDLKHKIEMKEKKINQLEESLDKTRLEKDRLEKQNSMFQHDSKPRVNRDSDRALQKMKQKITITEELFKQQLEILENDLAYMKRQCENSKNQERQKAEQLKKLKAQYEEMKKQYEEVSSQKQSLIEEFRKARNEYESHLKQKQRVFEQKIKQIKLIIQDSENKRRVERERVQEATKQYKRVLEDIQAAYEARIKQLENQVTHVEYIRKEVTPVGR